LVFATYVWKNLDVYHGSFALLKRRIEKNAKDHDAFYGCAISTYAGIVGAAAYFYAFFMWFGYMMPVTVSSVLFGSTKRHNWVKQISIMLGMQLVGLMLAAFILTM
jgi:hypothetical protein